MTEPKACPNCRTAVPTDSPGGACPRCLMALGFATDPGAPPPEVPNSEVERRFPGYEVISQLGRGGMGVVFRARQKALDREVALKVLPGGPTRGAEFVERFQREAKALARLQHPGIVQVFDFGASDDGWCFLAMELVLGANLRRVLAERRLSPKEALAIVPQICDALQYAHDQGVVHRDIKPENVLLTRDGRVKLADFGLAKLAGGARGPSLTGSGHVMGTPHYMAPEQVEHPGDVDHRADIYSLGVVFYEMLTGELPLGRFAAPSTKSDVDARIDAIVMRTLEKERSARFQHVSDVKTSLNAPALPPPIPAAAGRRAADAASSRLSRFAFATAFAPLAVALLAVLVWSANSAKLPDQRLGWAGLWTGTAAFVGFVASLAAWGRIRHSAGAMHGRWFAAMGLVGSFAGVAALIPLYVWDNARLVAQDGPRAAFLGRFDTSVGGIPYAARTPDAQAVRRLFERYIASGADRDGAVLDRLYAADDLVLLRAMPPDVRDTRRNAGLLGLPLATRDFLGVDPSLLAIEGLSVDGADGTLSVRSGDVSILVPLVGVRDATTGTSEWRFAMLPLTRSNHVRPGSSPKRSTPMDARGDSDDASRPTPR